MFIAAIFTIAKNWKPPKWSLTGEWINICTTEYYSEVKRKKRIHTTWMNLRMSESRQAQDITVCVISFI